MIYKQASRESFMESYISSDKKLQLVKKIREEHLSNQNTMRGREAFLYGKNVPYESFQQDMDISNDRGKEAPVSTFRFRMAAALVLFAAFYMLVSENRTIFGIRSSRIYEAVEEDYSSILFDFIEEIPYTLHE